jgi:hypothetical protein
MGSKGQSPLLIPYFRSAELSEMCIFSGASPPPRAEQTKNYSPGKFKSPEIADNFLAANSLDFLVAALTASLTAFCNNAV